MSRPSSHGSNKPTAPATCLSRLPPPQHQATLKTILFPVQRPGVYITAEWELFFFILPPKNLVVKVSLFSYQKKKKKNCGRPTGHNFGHPLDRKQTFLRVALWTCNVCPYSGSRGVPLIPVMPAPRLVTGRGTVNPERDKVVTVHQQRRANSLLAGGRHKARPTKYRIPIEPACLLASGESTAHCPNHGFCYTVMS